jgi:hypothetical protein
VARLVEKDQERILVLFGSGHGELLRELVAESPNLELVHARSYLGNHCAHSARPSAAAMAIVPAGDALAPAG